MGQVKKKEASGVLKQLIEWMETPEGKAELEKTQREMEREIEINDSHVERFHKLTVEEREIFILKRRKTHKSSACGM